MVGRELQQCHAGEFRRLDQKAVIARLDLDAEGRQGRHGGGDAVGVLVLEFPGIADNCWPFGTGGERRQQRQLVDHALHQRIARDFDAAQLVT